MDRIIEIYGDRNRVTFYRFRPAELRLVAAPSKSGVSAGITWNNETARLRGTCCIIT
jgi:hypothetical protein